MNEISESFFGFSLGLVPDWQRSLSERRHGGDASRGTDVYPPGMHIYENDQLHRMAPNSGEGT
jgi:hypothetical protein